MSNTAVLGNHLLSYRVMPPGLDLDKFYPYYHDMLPETEKDEAEIMRRLRCLKN